LHAGFFADREEALFARFALGARAAFAEPAGHEEAERNPAPRRRFDRFESDGDRNHAHEEIDCFG
jgi:hypothetical protein